MNLALSPTVHVALRLAPKAVVGNGVFDVIEEHNRVIDESGRVAFAKFVAHPDRRKPQVSPVLASIERGEIPFLITFYRRGSQVFAWRAPIANILVGRTPEGIKSPPYYGTIHLGASCWFILTARFEPCAIDEYYLARNKRSLAESVAKGQAIMMFVFRFSNPSPSSRP